MSRRAIEHSGPRDLAWYFVVTIGPNADGVVAGPFPDKPTRWDRKLAEDECGAALTAEQLKADEALEMAL